jgi:hypothetical protein
MAYLFNFTHRQSVFQLAVIKLQQHRYHLLERLQFIFVDVGTLVLLEPVEKEPQSRALGRYDGSGTATLALARQRNALFSIDGHPSLRPRVPEPSLSLHRAGPHQSDLSCASSG